MYLIIAKLLNFCETAAIDVEQIIDWVAGKQNQAHVSFRTVCKTHNIRACRVPGALFVYLYGLLIPFFN